MNKHVHQQETIDKELDVLWKRLQEQYDDAHKTVDKIRPLLAARAESIAALSLIRQEEPPAWLLEHLEQHPEDAGKGVSFDPEDLLVN